jgi:hypothetical protein
VGVEKHPRRIGKPEARLYRAGFRPAWLALGVPALVVGCYLCSMGAGLVPVPIEANAPLAIVAAAGVGFALFGGMLIVRSIAGMFHRWRMRVRRRRHPQQPWRFDFPWSPHGIEDERASRLATETIGVVLVWCLVTPFVWVAFFTPEIPFLGQVVVTGAAGLALVLTGAFLRGVLQFARYGRSRIVFGSFPFSPGGKLEVAFMPARFDALAVTLRYVEERFEVEEVGEGTTSIGHAAFVHHEEHHRVPVPPGAGAVAIELELPDKPEWVTQMTTAERGVRYWELLVQADVPGATFSTAFPLPVYLGEGTPTANPQFRRVLEGSGRS